MDTGVQFSKLGISTLVTIKLDSWTPDALRHEVLVVDTESRHDSLQAAYENIRRIAEWARNAGIPYLYKKTDSTLRGNVGSELAAAMDGFGSPTLCFAPAYPSQSRTTRHGVMYVDREPLTRSVFFDDPFSPIVSSWIPDILRSQTSKPALVVESGQLDALDLSRQEEGSILVFDAESDTDFDRIAAMLKRQPQARTVLAGSAGLARTLPDLIPFRYDAPPRPAAPGRVLVVCGSLNAVSRRQIARAESEGVPSIEIDKRLLFASSGDARQKNEEQFDCARTMLRRGPALILKHKPLYLRDAPGIKTVKLPRTEGSPPFNIAIAVQTGAFVARLAAETDVDLLLIVGGDTLFGILHSLHVREILPQEEILPGIVHSVVSHGGQELSFITKAGGFGSEDTILNLIRSCVKRDDVSNY